VTLYSTDLPLKLVSRGKVRDVYESAEGLLLVSTDRLSAFDVVFPDAIPEKGRVLNLLSAFWFQETKHIVDNHLLSSAPLKQLELDSLPGAAALRGRCSLCRTAKPLPVECVVRGYLEGSAWRDYETTGTVSGIRLPKDMKRRTKFPIPLFTPSTKATSGHDEPIAFGDVVDQVGVEVAEFIRIRSIQLYQFAHDRLAEKGILVSDTKFEFGTTGEDVILIDEALTPDSSRFWEAESYTSGGGSLSLDKQYVRDFVEGIGWDKTPPAPRLPAEVVANTSDRYVRIFERITDRSFEEVVGEES
jgi:phosphoribosylaminoimidazole-succinocarboxamide synthase